MNKDLKISVRVTEDEYNFVSQMSNKKGIKHSSFVYIVLKLLNEKGIVSQEDFDEHKTRQ